MREVKDYGLKIIIIFFWFEVLDVNYYWDDKGDWGRSSFRVGSEVKILFEMVSEYLWGDGKRAVRNKMSFEERLRWDFCFWFFDI